MSDGREGFHRQDTQDRPRSSNVLRDSSAASITAGFVAVLVGITSSVAIVFAAASTLGASASQTTSWLCALGLGMGLTSLGLALRYRKPVLTAWSTPGAALIAGSQGLTMGEAVGACMVCGALMALAGYSRLFERAMDRVPQAIAAALLAGVLTRFGLDGVLTVKDEPGVVVSMALVFLVARRWVPRYAVPLAFVTGITVAALLGSMAWQSFEPGFATLEWVAPAWSLQAMVGLALPLFIVTMASQNIPGVAAQRAAGYTDMPVSTAVGVTGLASLVLAPFGGYALNLAAITAAICMSPEAHDDASKRYTAVVWAGVFYLTLALFAGSVVSLLSTFPKALVLGIAALALVGTIVHALVQAFANDAHRDAAGLTFLVTLSGVSLFGIGSAFWGVVVGALALAVRQWRPR